MKGKKLIYMLAGVITFTYIATLVLGIDASAIRTTWYWRIAYMFLHGGLLHAAANVLCLIAIARSDFKTPAHFVLMAILVAMLAPMGNDTITLGCSGVCYAMLGSMSWQSADIKRFHSLIVLFIVLGFLPWLHVNYMLHAFCYIEGVLFGWICSE